MISCNKECLFQDNLLAVVDEQALSGVVNTLTLQVVVYTVFCCCLALYGLDSGCTTSLPNINTSYVNFIITKPTILYTVQVNIVVNTLVVSFLSF